MGQSPPFVLVNLVVVIKRAFVGMAGDLNYLVPWLSGFLQFCNNRLSGGMIGNSRSVYIYVVIAFIVIAFAEIGRVVLFCLYSW